MRRAVLSGACAVLLAGPTALAFFTGGYFDEARNWAGVAAWALVVVALVFVRVPLPRSRSGWLSIVALALFAGWTLVSFTWAPVAGSAYHAGQRVLLYVAVLVAATALLHHRAALRAVEPALAAGTLIVVGYGLAGRLLPGLLHFQRSISAQGRLEQPLTYWNAMGEVAALGFVLCVRIAGDRKRPRWLRAVAAAGAAPLGMGLYLTFSRGALFACVAGLIALVVLAPSRAQLRTILILVLVGALAAAASAPFHGVTSLSGRLGTREQDGAVALGLLVLLAVLAAALQWLWQRRESEARVRLPRHSGWIALGLICAGLAVAIVVGAKESSATSQLRPGAATRFETVQSSRYAYWKVALRAFGDQPVRGVGAGGWAVYWLRDRPINDFAQDAHSLELQTIAELGVIGGLLLLAFFIAMALAARGAYRAAPGLAAGPIAGLIVYLAHSPLDWDWQMPAVTLIALVLAGATVALGEPAARRGTESDEVQSASAMRGASRRNTQTASAQIPT